MASAASGIRATSALTNTMAVNMDPRYRRRLEPGSPAPGAQPGSACGSVLEGSDRVARRTAPALCREAFTASWRATWRAAPLHRAGPLALEMDQTHPGLLEPSQDLLGLLGGGGRCRPGTVGDGLGARSEQVDPVDRRAHRAGSPRLRRAGRAAPRGRPSAGRPRCVRPPAPGSRSAPRVVGCGWPHGRRPPAGPGAGSPPRSARRPTRRSIRSVSASTTSSARCSRLSRRSATIAA